jgi:zinc transport system ATP-binding protein
VSPDAAPIVGTRRLVVSFDGHTALAGVDLTLVPGEFVALMGANGSGKTTLVRTLLGLQDPTSGDVNLFGTPVQSFRDWGRVGYVPQRLRIAGGIPVSVAEGVSAGLVVNNRRGRRRTAAQRHAVRDALETVGLTDRARDRVATLSGGQQQRVVIARALVTDPDLVVMDEPLAGVDLQHQEDLAATLTHVSRAGRTVLVVLHEVGPLRPLITRAVVLSHGRVEHDGEPPWPEGEHAHPAHVHVHDHDASPGRYYRPTDAVRTPREPLP